MTFTSPLYFLFWPAAFLVFYFSRDKYRWLVLLLASLAFYAALKAPSLLIALTGVTVLTYFSGRGVAAAMSPGRKTLVFWLGVTANLAILIGFRYLAVLIEGFNALSGAIGGGRHVFAAVDPISIGVSYYSFQAISYLVDVYLDVEKPEKHFGYFALYISFFPKLLQGPIERAGDFLPQLRQPYVFCYENVRSGLLLFAWGLFKKVVISDRLALFVNEVYGNVHAFSGLPLIIATYFYAFQIYCDFSGYTDMALGTSRIFNFKLTQNFENPYRATSIAMFWRRWHISFSRWILDYIFKPLQFRFRYWRDWGTALALVITFLACGVWHGATAGFVIWGLLHGLYMSCSVLYRGLGRRFRRKKRSPTALIETWRVIATFHLVCLAWIFFRARSLADAFYVINHSIAGLPSSLVRLAKRDSLVHDLYLNQSNKEFFLAVACLGLLAVLARATTAHEAAVRAFRQWAPGWLRWSAYLGFVLAVVVFGVFYGGAFIYFQF